MMYIYTICLYKLHILLFFINYYTSPFFPNPTTTTSTTTGTATTTGDLSGGVPRRLSAA